MPIKDINGEVIGVAQVCGRFRFIKKENLNCFVVLFQFAKSLYSKFRRFTYKMFHNPLENGKMRVPRKNDKVKKVSDILSVLSYKYSNVELKLLGGTLAKLCIISWHLPFNNVPTDKVNLSVTSEEILYY